MGRVEGSPAGARGCLEECRVQRDGSGWYARRLTRFNMLLLRAGCRGGLRQPIAVDMADSGDGPGVLQGGGARVD